MTAIPFEKSFASHEKSKYWSDKNTKKPRDVYKSSHTKYWFDCDKCNHSFDSILYSVVKGPWCPYCSNKKLCENNECIECFNNSFASHEKSKYWSEKNTEKPKNVFKSSHTKYWFHCNKCNHSFDSGLNDIVRGQWCPYCSNKKLCENNECIDCFNNSFASHEKSKYWSEKNTEKPRNVFKSTDKKYWFDCDKCHHSFHSLLANINKGSWCSYCGNKLICDNNTCDFCYNNSFASHEKSKYWSEKNTENPRDVFKSSNNKYWFDCHQCQHSFNSALNNIVCIGSWCPYCSNQKLCENNECVLCYSNSFASHEKSKYWSEKNTEKPRNVFKCSNKKYWFDCNSSNHSFDSRLNHIVFGKWCPYCKNKSEKKIYEMLIVIYPTLIRDFKKQWCRRKNYLPFDFCIPEYKIIIELDGRQHFQQVPKRSSPEEQFENDKYKEKCANENGYLVIRILQEDVLYDKYDWLKELCDSVEKIINGYEKNIYLCKNEEYSCYTACV